MTGLVIAAVGTLVLPILLPIAGVSINVGVLVSVGMVIGFLSGLLGVGGGFLTTPILMMIGIPPIVAAASDTNAIVATSASGVAAHFRLRNVDFKMGGYCLLGGLLGSAVGVQAVKLLGARGNADLLISVMYVVILGAVGGFMVYNSLAKLRRGVMAPKLRQAKSNAFTTLLARLPFQTEFARSGVSHSILLPFALCFVVGIMTAFMGVGGGFIMVPAMVYLLRMPAHVAVGICGRLTRRLTQYLRKTCIVSSTWKCMRPYSDVARIPVREAGCRYVSHGARTAPIFAGHPIGSNT
jgi:hypothetical protein